VALKGRVDVDVDGNGLEQAMVGTDGPHTGISGRLLIILY